VDVFEMEIVRKAGGCYALEAKLAPNHWQRVDEIYPEIDGLKAHYGSRVQAEAAKAELKRFLIRARATNGSNVEKRPIRIRRLGDSPK
jgi:hypothetical protein